MAGCSPSSSPPARIGPVEFGELGRVVAVRCPKELAHIVQRAGGVWEPGSRRWLVDRRRIGPLIRALEATTDPLFRLAMLRMAMPGEGEPLQRPKMAPSRRALGRA